MLWKIDNNIGHEIEIAMLAGMTAMLEHVRQTCENNQQKHLIYLCVSASL